jgi:hypothetical protein
MSELTLVNAAAEYARGIRARRDVLSTLFYAVKNSSADAWAYYTRQKGLEQSEFDGRAVSVPSGRDSERLTLIEARKLAEASAQDSAWALFLIADYSLQRLRPGIGGIDLREVGPDLAPGVKFNRMVWAIANQARHAHDWQSRSDAILYAQHDVQTIVALHHDPRNANAAREILVGMPDVISYVDLEDKLLATAHELLEGTGYYIEPTTGGSFSLEQIT